MNKSILLILSLLIFSHTSSAMNPDEDELEKMKSDPGWNSNTSSDTNPDFDIVVHEFGHSFLRQRPKTKDFNNANEHFRGIYYITNEETFGALRHNTQQIKKEKSGDIAENNDYVATQFLAENYFTLGMEEYKKKTTESYKEALKFFHIAAEMEHDIAENSVGAMYEYGLGTDKNIELAKKWYKKAAKNGNTSAKKSLNRIYEKENSTSNKLYKMIFG